MRLRARLLLIFLLAVSLPAFAESASQLKPSGYVNDFAHVINAATAAQLEDMCRQVDDKAHAQISLVTINTLDGSDVESYAVDLFKQWGIGAKSTNRGVLILYAIRDHKARIEVGYGLEPILPDGKVGGFQREAIPILRGGNYSEALSLVTTRVADVIASDAGVQLSTPQPEPAYEPVPQRHDNGISFGGIILIIVIVLIVLVTPLRSLLFWILLNSIFGGRGGGYRGGGGGGFGGFGGGSSGGGGASSSW